MTQIFDFSRCTLSEIHSIWIGNTLLEMHFNIQGPNGEQSFSFEISSDAETIYYHQKRKWVTMEDCPPAFEMKGMEDLPINLLPFVGNTIDQLRFGVGRQIHTLKLFYIELIIPNHTLLFFNNGDEGWYVVDRTQEIMDADIYEVWWENTPPHIGSMD